MKSPAKIILQVDKTKVIFGLKKLDYEFLKEYAKKERRTVTNVIKFALTKVLKRKFE